MSTELRGDLVISGDILYFQDKQVGPVSLLELLECCKENDGGTNPGPNPNPVSMYSPFVYRFTVDAAASNQGTHPTVTNISQFSGLDSLTHGDFKTTIVNNDLDKGWASFTYYPGSDPDNNPITYPRGAVLGLMTTKTKTIKFPDEVNAAIVSYTMPIQWGSLGISQKESIRVMGMRQRLQCAGTDVKFPAKGTTPNTTGAFSRQCSNVLNLKPIKTTDPNQGALTADERANRQWYTISTVITFPKGSVINFTGFADAQRLGRSEIVVGAGQLTIQPYSLSDDELINNFGTVGSGTVTEENYDGMIFSDGDQDLAEQIAAGDFYISYPDQIEMDAITNYAQRMISALEARKANPPTLAELPPGVSPRTSEEYDDMIKSIYEVFFNLVPGLNSPSSAEQFLSLLADTLATDPSWGLVVQPSWAPANTTVRFI